MSFYATILLVLPLFVKILNDHLRQSRVNEQMKTDLKVEVRDSGRIRLANEGIQEFLQVGYRGI